MDVGLAVGGTPGDGAGGRAPPFLNQLVAWFDPSTGITASSGSVDAWKCRVSGVSLTHTSTNRPTTTALINGKPSVTFTAASSQTLANTAASIAAFVNNTGYTSFFVAKPSALAQRYLMSTHDGTGASSTRSGQGVFATNGSQATRHDGTTETINSGASAVVLTAGLPHTVVYQYTGSAINTRIDSIVDLSGSANTRVLATQVVYCLGGIYVSAASRVLFWNGEIGDHLLYRSILTAGQCQSVELWLRKRYGF